MGYGQFIPSSYRSYAIDFDGDGIRNIVTNPIDAIGSVANYLSKHGWEEFLIAEELTKKDVNSNFKTSLSLKEASALELVSKKIFLIRNIYKSILKIKNFGWDIKICMFYHAIIEVLSM